MAGGGRFAVVEGAQQFELVAGGFEGMYYLWGRNEF